jgi:hypothetical protein
MNNAGATTMTTYQDVIQAIRNGAAAEDVEAMIASPRSQLTDAQMADLRDELTRRDAESAAS